MKRIPENKRLLSLIEMLKKEKKPFWKKIAQELSKPKRRRPAVNVSKIDKYAKEDSLVVVPGKVLASGNLSKKVKVAAFNFSEAAVNIIKKNGGEIISIEDALKSDPEAKTSLLLI